MRRGRMFAALGGIVLALVAGPVATVMAAGSVARRPPMGWNSWNSFGCDVSESLIRQMADALVSTGMRDAGYRYVVVDDCWFDPQRGPAGELRGDPVRFPSGMKALADYVHARGLKFGLYEVPTERTCAQRGGVYPGLTGSGGHEAQDARTFASWGVDYLKYDWCSPAGALGEQLAAFRRMRDALRATGRPIVYSINPNSYHDVKTGASYDWGGIANLWRTTEDIKPIWDTGHSNEYPLGVANIIDVEAGLAGRARAGHWNDPDMLEVGVAPFETFPGLTLDESRAHFGMWAMLAAPLIAGNDARSTPAAALRILRNRRVIAIDQDRRARQGVRVRQRGATEVWVKPLAHGDRALGLLNRSGARASIRARLRDVGWRGGRAHAQNLWTGRRSRIRGAIVREVPAHGLALLRLTR
jgi:alpha-galactosidase